MKQKNESSAMMMGIGFDHKDGQKRITKGKNFLLVGGSEETHERMTETAIKVNEKLSSKGKTLDSISREEFFDLLSECSDS